MNQVPKIGKTVRYVHKIDTMLDAEIPNKSPAMITQVYPNDVVDLAVFHSNGTFYNLKVVKGGVDERGHWSFFSDADDPNG